MDKKTFDTVYKIMKLSFPKNEFRTYEGQKKLLNHPDYRIYTETDQDGETIGFLAVWQFSSFSYVENLAVDPQIRNGGIGRKLLTTFMVNTLKPILLEVEPPDQGIATRRIGFYERLGFYLNDFDYVQPALRPETKPLKLQIMSYPTPLTEQQFMPYRDTLYKVVYRENGRACVTEQSHL